MIKKLITSVILALSVPVIAMASATLNAEIDTNVITLTLDTDDASKKNIVVKAEDAQGELLHIRLVSCDNNGVLNYSFEIPDTLTSGKIGLSVAEHGFAQQMTTTVYYTDSDDRKTILDNINNAESASDIETLLKNYSLALGLGDTLNKYSLYAKELYANNPFSDFSEIKEHIVNVQALLDSLNSCQWVDLYDFTVSNPSVVAASSKYDTYAAKTETTRNKISKNVMDCAPFSDFDEFCAKLDKYTSEQTSSVSSGNGGGGGGGSSSGSSSVYIPAVTKPSDLQEETVRTFSDLENCIWATDAINVLLEEGVISMPEDEKFRPFDKITREEFVKMIVCVLGVENDDCEVNFNDVVRGAWYERYVAAAIYNNLIYGYSDDVFGIGCEITRQDIAAILYRVILKTGLEIPGETGDIFADFDDISEYAAEAVTALYAAGIVNGDGGKFFPTQNASRAEAVQMIYGLCNKAGGVDEIGRAYATR